MRNLFQSSLLYAIEMLKKMLKKLQIIHDRKLKEK